MAASPHSRSNKFFVVKDFQPQDDQHAGRFLRLRPALLMATGAPPLPWFASLRAARRILAHIIFSRCPHEILIYNTPTSLISDAIREGIPLLGNPLTRWPPEPGRC